MALSNILNVIGLSFDIVGVLMLFKYGLPPEVYRGGIVPISFEDSEDKKEKAKASQYERYSYIALAFLVVGFLFQISTNIFLSKI